MAHSNSTYTMRKEILVEVHEMEKVKQKTNDSVLNHGSKLCGPEKMYEVSERESGKEARGQLFVEDSTTKHITSTATELAVRMNEMTPEHSNVLAVAAPNTTPSTSSSSSSAGRVSSTEELSRRRKYRTTNFSISHEDLSKHFGKTIVEAARSLGVSKSTLQRACRHINIEKWPFPKKVNSPSTSNMKPVEEVVFKRRKKLNNPSPISNPEEVVRKKKKKVKDRLPTSTTKHVEEKLVMEKREKVNNPPTCNPLPLYTIATTSPSLERTTAINPLLQHTADVSPPLKHTIAISAPECTTTIMPLSEQGVKVVTIKATHGDDIIRFEIPSSSRMADLLQKVTMRLPMKDGSFKIKYLDEENDWVLLACDEDVQQCFSIWRSSGRSQIRMMVQPIAN